MNLLDRGDDGRRTARREVEVRDTRRRVAREAAAHLHALDDRRDVRGAGVVERDDLRDEPARLTRTDRTERERAAEHAVVHKQVAVAAEGRHALGPLLL